jgi:hypothetical protein
LFVWLSFFGILSQCIVIFIVKFRFTELSKIVSEKWKAMSDSEKQFYRDVSAQDWDRYQREMEVFKNEQQQQQQPQSSTTSMVGRGGTGTTVSISANNNNNNRMAMAPKTEYTISTAAIDEVIQNQQFSKAVASNLTTAAAAAGGNLVPAATTNGLSLVAAAQLRDSTLLSPAPPAPLPTTNEMPSSQEQEKQQQPQLESSPKSEKSDQSFIAEV